MILDTVNDKKNYLGTDMYGNDWYAKNLRDGSQIWVKAHNTTISDAGKNGMLRKFNKESGLNINPKEDGTWRGKK